MEFVDGEEVLYEDSCAFEGDSVSLEFPMKLFKEKQKEYKIKVQVLDTEGKVFDTLEQRVYMYPRPGCLNEKGIRPVRKRPSLCNVSVSVRKADSAVSPII